MNIIIGILGLVLLIGSVIWAISKQLKQSKRDWQTVHYLKNKSKQVKTPAEIIEFYDEFIGKAKNIHNDLCEPHLAEINGYLTGLLKGLKNEKK